MWDSSQALDVPISSEAIDECGPTPPGKQQRSGGAGSSSDRYDEVMLSPVAMPPPQAAGAARGGRGKFVRAPTMLKRRSWQMVIEEHMLSFPRLLTTSVCGADCSGCDIFSWASVSVLQQCAMESFGDAVILVDWTGTYDWKEEAKKLRSNHLAVSRWFGMVFSMRYINTDSTISIAFHIAGRTVCSDTWPAFHGVPARTMKDFVRLVKQGCTVWNNEMAKQTAIALRTEKGNLRTAAAQWWYLRLDYYEMIVDTGKIQYPSGIDWRMVHDVEFVPEMQLLGYDWRTSTQTVGSVGSTSTWYEGRAEALQQLAHDRIAPTAKPFSFVSRAKHSAYVRDQARRNPPMPTPPPHYLHPYLVCVCVCVCAEGVPSMPNATSSSGRGHQTEDEPYGDP